MVVGLRQRGSAQVSEVETDRELTWAEVRKHGRPGDAWVVIGGSVYDVSTFRHPGGNVMLSHAGADATDVFTAFHAKSTFDKLPAMKVGHVSSRDPRLSAKSVAILADFRRLRTRARRMGLFEVNAAYYVWKVVSTAALAMASVWLLSVSTAWLAVLASAVLLALFYQQSGWLAHDFCHHQVFQTQRLLGGVFGLMLGNVWQGFSLSWWLDKHNTHHSVPNMHESTTGAHDGDPDIDTMPLLAWSERMAKSAGVDPSSSFFLRFQPLLYFPILLVARLSWLMQSYTHAFSAPSMWSARAGADGRPPASLRFVWGERIGLLMHAAWTLGMLAVYLHDSPVKAVVHFLTAQCVTGFFLALAFGVGHNGMAVFDYDDGSDFVTRQVLSTRNVHGSWLVGWFMGGLHLQLEHHLLPTMPRHQLHRVTPLVRELCETHGLRYHSASLWDGNVEVVQHLAQVRDALAEFPAM